MSRTTTTTWEEILAQFEELWSPHRDAVTRVLAEASAFFDDQSRGKEFNRRPNLSLRLSATGDLAAKLVLCPGWTPRYKTVTPAIIDVEFLVCRGRKSRAELRLQSSEHGITPCRWSLLHSRDALLRLAAVCHDFLEAPAVVFARSASHCCICGRPLTDGLSKARGIGPECMDRCGWVRRQFETAAAILGARPCAPTAGYVGGSCATRSSAAVARSAVRCPATAGTSATGTPSA
jgi:hypothetical protein